jgi:hypothetical protein
LFSVTRRYLITDCVCPCVLGSKEYISFLYNQRFRLRGYSKITKPQWGKVQIGAKLTINFLREVVME